MRSRVAVGFIRTFHSNVCLTYPRYRDAVNRKFNVLRPNFAQNETTDEHRAAKPQPKTSHHEDTKTRRNPFAKNKGFSGVLRVSAVRFGVQALACYGPRAA